MHYNIVRCNYNENSILQEIMQKDKNTNQKPHQKMHFPIILQVLRQNDLRHKQ